jgi:hypothetical protein
MQHSCAPLLRQPLVSDVSCVEIMQLYVAQHCSVGSWNCIQPARSNMDAPVTLLPRREPDPHPDPPSA